MKPAKLDKVGFRTKLAWANCLVASLRLAGFYNPAETLV